jgi:endo-1,3-1,4-beta-glycanase ExoK
MSSRMSAALAYGVAVLASLACSGKGATPASGAGASGATSVANGGASSTGGSGVVGGASSAAGSASGGTSGATAGGGALSGGAGSANSAGSANGGASASSAGSGGSSGTAGAGGDPFVLSWQDDFNTLDTSAWQLQNFTYDGNEAQFAPGNASVNNGVLTIALSNAASGAAKPYVGVEMRSAKTLTYGKVSARMRFATGSGVVSGLVLFYTPYPNCDWNEIDVEHLGDSSMTSQLNAMVYLGAQVPTCTTSVTPTQDPLVVNLGFNAESDYHLYDIEWTPSGVTYSADGVVLRDWTKNIALLKRPLTVLLTIWASNSASWAGALTASSAPTSADIDWIKVYDWNGSGAQ